MKDCIAAAAQFSVLKQNSLDGISPSLVSWCSGRRGGNQAGDQHAEEVLPPQKHRYLLWSLHQEEPPGPR